MVWLRSEYAFACLFAVRWSASLTGQDERVSPPPTLINGVIFRDSRGMLLSYVSCLWASAAAHTTFGTCPQAPSTVNGHTFVRQPIFSTVNTKGMHLPFASVHESLFIRNGNFSCPFPSSTSTSTSHGPQTMGRAPHSHIEFPAASHRED